MENLAVLGPEGTFSDSASKAYLTQNNLDLHRLYYPTVDDVFHAVGKTCGYGIIPVENTLDGYVQRSLDLLLEMDIHILQEITVPVQFSLIANTDRLQDIHTLYVQFKTNGQCREFIDSLPNKKIITTESNMESYHLAQQGHEGEAAIIPRHILDQSDARFKIENVTDSENNFTRFLVIRPSDESDHTLPGKDVKVSLYIMPAIDRPGILYEILREFYTSHINLVSVISRPTKKNMGTYNFYFELTGSYEQKDTILSAISRIHETYPAKIVGMYGIEKRES